MKTFVVALAMAAALSSSGHSESCQNKGSLEAWLADFKREALAAGISRKTVAEGLDGLTFDQGIINKDRGQGVFAQTFLEFSTRMVAPYRMQQGAAQIQKHQALFNRIEKEYGVPAPVIVAYWGLETDFGGNSGKSPALRSLATLAYDCRRPEMFRPELLAALKIIDRGDLPASQMIGAWAGEVGQMQFLPTRYVEFGIDYDGDGRRDLRNSVPDSLASTANYLMNLGWRRGEPWLQEVKVPANLPWDQADLAIQHPRSQWAKWGVMAGNGTRLTADTLPASLLLPMGRHGPAFLAYPNFQVYLKWNQSLVYSTTAAYFATRLAGAPQLSHGSGELALLSPAQLKEVQEILGKSVFDIGKIDGVVGQNTRAAVKAMQIKLGLPADSYPTMEFYERLRRGRS
jgi:lytic murein transglycosylase